MHTDGPMKAELLREIVLLGTGIATVIAFLIVIAASVTSAAAAMQ